jgi:hypothetical protein
MMSREANDSLSRVGPGTFMGKLLRRYWAPFLLASEIPEPDCPPVRARLMGESVIAFATVRAHRPDRRILCAIAAYRSGLARTRTAAALPYHGWKYDVTGMR